MLDFKCSTRKGCSGGGLSGMFVAPVVRSAADDKKRDQQNVVQRSIRELKSSDYEVQKQSALRLANIGPGAAPAVSSLVRALKRPFVDDNDEEEFPNVELVTALMKIGPKGQKALRKCLRSRKKRLRLRALVGLSWIKHPAPALAPAVVPFLKKKDVGGRDIAVITLGKMAKVDVQTCQYLERLLKKKKISIHVAMALSSAAPQGKAAVPVLIKHLVALLKKKKYLTKYLQALAKYGKQASGGVPVVQDIIKTHPDVGTRRTAAKVLLKIGGGGTKEYPSPIPNLGSRNHHR